MTPGSPGVRRWLYCSGVGRPPDVAVERPTRRAWLTAAGAVLCVAATAVAGLAAMDPGFVVALVPGWSASPTAAGRSLQILGASVLLMPVLAAVVAHRQGRSRAAGWCVVLALVAFVPAGKAMERGAAEVRQARTADSPAPGACMERSGGDTTCPGG